MNKGTTVARQHDTLKSGESLNSSLFNPYYPNHFSSRRSKLLSPRARAPFSTSTKKKMKNDERSIIIMRA
uniref:Uncharacterized protein n=1 Tax=Trichogramma kaykai TaxID=54128 RepID=A0ABD2WWS5_9HYME